MTASLISGLLHKAVAEVWLLWCIWWQGKLTHGPKGVWCSESLFSLSLSVAFSLRLYLFTCLPVYLLLYLFDLSWSLSISLILCPSVCVYLSRMYLSSYLSIYLSICKEAILQDFLHKLMLTGPKRRKSAKLPQNMRALLDLFNDWIWQRQKGNNCATLSPKNGKISAELMASFQCVSQLSPNQPTVLRLPRKSDARSHKVLHLSRGIILANLKIWCSRAQPPNMSDGGVSCSVFATWNWWSERW